MADPFVAEIRLYPFNFAPRGWAWCDGQLMPLSQNTALFSLLGTTYGGNGTSNFALPNLQGRAPMHPGQGPGLSLYDLGEQGGQKTVALTTAEIPAHSHSLSAMPGAATQRSPEGAAWSGDRRSPVLAFSDAARDSTMANSAIAEQGAGQPHNNMQPYLTFYFCIALQGIFPPRG